MSAILDSEKDNRVAYEMKVAAYLQCCETSRTALVVFTGQKPVETCLKHKGIKEYRYFSVFSANFKSYRYRQMYFLFLWVTRDLKNRCLQFW